MGLFKVFLKFDQNQKAFVKFKENYDIQYKYFFYCSLCQLLKRPIFDKYMIFMQNIAFRKNIIFWDDSLQFETFYVTAIWTVLQKVIFWT